MKRLIYANKVYFFGWEEFESFLSTEVFKKPIELCQEDFYYWSVRDEEMIDDEEYSKEDYDETIELLGKALGLKIERVLIDEYNVYVIGN